MVSRQWLPPEGRAPAWPACCALSSRKSTMTGCNDERRSRMAVSTGCTSGLRRLVDLRLRGLVVRQVLREPQRLREDEEDHEPHPAEQLEVHPEVGRIRERHVEVQRPLEEEEEAPGDAELEPHALGQLEPFGHHRLHQILAEGE